MTDFWQKTSTVPPSAGSHSGRQGAGKPARAAILPQSAPIQPLTFTVPGSPIGKPRMTRRDKWAKRPAVLKYRDWADAARKAAGTDKLPDRGADIVAYFPMPESWSKKKKAEMGGKPHRVKPDLDNVIKCLDALFENDSMIYAVSARKFWDDGEGARTVVTLW